MVVPEQFESSAANHIADAQANRDHCVWDEIYRVDGISFEEESGISSSVGKMEEAP